MSVLRLFRYWVLRLFSPGVLLRERYGTFRRLLESDRAAHRAMAELQEIGRGDNPVDLPLVKTRYEALFTPVSSMVKDLRIVAPLRYGRLAERLAAIDFSARSLLASPPPNVSPPFVLSLGDPRSVDEGLAGGKAAGLARIAADLGLPIPRGFVVTTRAFHRLFEANGLGPLVEDLLSSLDVSSPASLHSVSADIADLVMRATVPADVAQDVLKAYDDLGRAAPGTVRTAVRSSAVGEDGEHSFAGLYHTVLDVSREDLLEAYVLVVASKYGPAALAYRIRSGLMDGDAPMAVLVQELLDARAGGVIYTQAVDEQRPETLLLHSVWGLGDLLVNGSVIPDRIRILKGSPPRILSTEAGDKPEMLVRGADGAIESIPLTLKDRRALSIDPESAVRLASWAAALENRRGIPLDIEWCMDRGGNLFLLQARPLREAAEAPPVPEDSSPRPSGPVLIEGGETASKGLASGTVFVVERDSQLKEIPEGAVLVASQARPCYAAALGRVAAVVTGYGSPAGHLASVAREFRIPFLAGVGEAAAGLRSGQAVTVHAEARRVYSGVLQGRPAGAERPQGALSQATPLRSRIRAVMDLVSPLHLLDPGGVGFAPEGCRSLHDVIRFCHEKAVAEMFSTGERRSGTKEARRMRAGLPLSFSILDVGGGVRDTAPAGEIAPEDVLSVPLRAFLEGLSDPRIHWSDLVHFSWGEFDSMVAGGGIVSPDDEALASFAVVSGDYMNVSIRFGYHFVILDTVCGSSAEGNHAALRFVGGGGDIRGRGLRACFLQGVLDRLGFRVTVRGDLLEAWIKGDASEALAARLRTIGRLLGATRVMDMYLKDEGEIPGLVGEFMAGRSHFTAGSAESRRGGQDG